ncbi:hypothetical protein JVU11DRAFT_2065 [Chiua virens]|nr:hypothetical protein JVU11DRAFT_2065 [Chiua virens]
MAFSQPFPLAANSQKVQSPTYGPDLAVRLICPDCRDPNPNIVEEFGSGDLVCGGCGLVLGDRIVDTRSEWRTFANDEGDDPSRVGAASDPLLEGMEQLDTVISFRDWRFWYRTVLAPSATSSLRSATSAAGATSSRCPKPLATSPSSSTNGSDEEKLLRGKPLEAVIAACIFIACRQAHCSEDV